MRKKDLRVGFFSSPVFVDKDNDNSVGALFYSEGRNLGRFEVQDKPEIVRMRAEANLGKEFVICLVHSCWCAQTRALYVNHQTRGGCEGKRVNGVRGTRELKEDGAPISFD